MQGCRLCWQLLSKIDLSSVYCEVSDYSSPLAQYLYEIEFERHPGGVGEARVASKHSSDILLGSIRRRVA
jgi:hypothetical protein